jgi:4-hydroxybutyrate CoA-transferase
MTQAPTLTSDWQSLYRQRLVTAEDTAARVRPGDHVYLPVAQQVHTVVAALIKRGNELRDVTVTCLPAMDYGWLAPEFEGRITVNILYANPFTREAVARGVADYTPFMIYGHHKGLDEGREEQRPIDMNVISVTPPNQHGYVCLGHTVWDAKTCVRRAAMTVAVVNEHLPRTFGDSWLHVSEIDWFVEDHTPLPDPTARTYPPPDPWDAPIAGYVGSLVRDGDTIQIGTGSTTGNLLRLGGLDDKHDLGYFGELTVPGTIDLVKRGIITGRRMATHPGKFVATTAGNGPADRAFIDGNPMFEFYAVDYIHDPRVISRNDSYVAINNAISVDLTGQVAASSIGPRVWSGTGGHFSFAMGAFLSRGGRYVCVLPSTARSGTVSRIVPHFDAGQIVTVPRDIADTVVTEYGIARLLNRSVRERAEALIAVAHPDFRAELRRAARRLFWPDSPP